MTSTRSCSPSPLAEEDIVRDVQQAVPMSSPNQLRDSVVALSSFGASARKRNAALIVCLGGLLILVMEEVTLFGLDEHGGWRRHSRGGTAR